MFNYLVYWVGSRPNVHIFENITELIGFLRDTTPEEDEILEIITLRK